MIENYDSEDVNKVKYNGVSELDILKLLGLKVCVRRGELRDHELEWSNYKKIGKNLNRKNIFYPPDLDDVDVEWE